MQEMRYLIASISFEIWAGDGAVCLDLPRQFVESIDILSSLSSASSIRVNTLAVSRVSAERAIFSKVDVLVSVNNDVAEICCYNKKRRETPESQYVFIK